MKRITVSVPDDLCELVTREAERRGSSVSELVRTSLHRLLRTDEEREIPWAGLVDEPTMTYGADIDDALEDEWNGAITGDSR